MVDVITRYSKEQMLEYREKFTDPPYPGWDLKKILQNSLEKGKRKLKGDDETVAWRPHKPETEAQQVTKLVRGVLNRLTPEKYDILIDQLKTPLLLSDAAFLTLAIQGLFEKALQEPNFCLMYATACFDLAFYELHQGNQESTGTKVKSKFRGALLQTVQHEFAKTLMFARETATNTTTAVPSPNSEETMEHMKNRALANIEFIGALATKSMISESITLNHIVARLLEEEMPSDMSVELLTALILIVGSQMNHLLDPVFNRIGELIAKPYSPRIKFMLLDLVETRKNGWIRRVIHHDKATPKKLEELDKEREILSKSPGTPLVNKRLSTRSKSAGEVPVVTLPLPDMGSTFSTKVLRLADDSTDPTAGSLPQEALHALCSSELIATFDVVMACSVYELMNLACSTTKDAKRAAVFHFLKYPNTWHDTHVDYGFAFTLSHAILNDLKSDTPLYFDRYIAGMISVLTPPRGAACIRIGTEHLLKALETDEAMTPDDAKAECKDILQAYLGKVKSSLNTAAKRNLKTELELCTSVFGEAVEY